MCSPNSDPPSYILFAPDLCVLHHSNLGGAQHPTVELEALLLNKEDGVVLFALLCSHKCRLVLIRVELLADGVEALEAVLLECVLEDAVGHFETLAKVRQILQILRLLLGRQLRLGHHREGPVQVVDAVYQVLGKALDGELARILDLALGAILQVAEVGNCAKAFVLYVVSAQARVIRRVLPGTIMCHLPSILRPLYPWSRISFSAQQRPGPHLLLLGYLMLAWPLRRSPSSLPPVPPWAHRYTILLLRVVSSVLL